MVLFIKNVPKAIIGRSSVMPGVFIGTKICDCCPYFSAVGSVFPIRIMILQCSEPAPVIHHFEPLITYSSPSRSMPMPTLVAS